MGAQDHKEQSKAVVGRVALIAVSDTRTAETNVSGKRAAELLRKAGHEVAVDRLVPNDALVIRDAVKDALKKADLVATMGGTGISRRDLTVDAVQELILRELPGFGELFRAMSAADIGTAAILSRALLAVTTDRNYLCCLPGSEDAVGLAFDKILIPELPHLLRELRK
jgi:molybdenum cofactor biosynthesis protein B